MRDVNYSKTIETLLTKDIMKLVSEIQKHKGQQNLFVQSKADILQDMLNVAKIQSTDASNRIEGIYTSPKRLEDLVKDKTKPINRDENEIIGYHDVLNTINDSYDDIPVNGNIIRQLHRAIEKYSANSLSGQYKNNDNSIMETRADGTKIVRFKPVSVFETEMAIDLICQEYSQVIDLSDLESLLLIPCFILDFLCIHPFNDGNGRMSRLLTLLLLYRSGYIVGKYISIEMIVEKTEENYYESLKLSSLDWHESTSDYRPFVTYFLSILLNAYKEFESRVSYVSLDKNDRVEKLFENILGKMTKKEILAKCPDITEGTLNQKLKSLVENDTIIVSKKGNTNYYIFNHNKCK